MELTNFGKKIHLNKYSKKLDSGSYETWEQTCFRVAEFVSRKDKNNLQNLADYLKIMVELTFIPGGRVLANAGTDITNLMNCFVLPIDDSRTGIYNTLSYAAEIFAKGGGVGYNFSKLRPEGAPVNGVPNIASGPVKFMEIFNTTAEVISQSSRRGAQMGILNVDHPDIIKFIKYKNNLNINNYGLLDSVINSTISHFNDVNINSDHLDTVFSFFERYLIETQLSHFNISVGINDKFMEEPVTEILDAIASSAHGSGDPGVIFLDTINKYNTVPYIGDIESTNPCGEVPLLPYEACCLGSINLFNFVSDDFFDFQYLERVVKFAIRFLDSVQSLSYSGISVVDMTCRNTRRLGLGVMGWADVLHELGMDYDSKEALNFASYVAKFIQTKAWEASMELAEELGPFPLFDYSKFNWDIIDNLGLPRKPVRNVAVTSLAPTGTIALLANVNSGIEPFFSKHFVRNVTNGGTEVIDKIKSNYKDAKTAHDISWKSHIDMQAAWQEFVCNAVSKTINMPESSTVDDIKDAYKYAWQSGCKGITIYRDKSRNFQILNTGESDD